MVLVEWDTAPKQQRLLEILQKDGPGIPNNIAFSTAIRYSIEKRFPASKLRFFSTDCDEDSTPHYVFFFEENNNPVTRLSCERIEIARDLMRSMCIARPPTRPHEERRLLVALADLIFQFRHRLDCDHEIRMLSDRQTLEALHDSASPAHIKVSSIRGGEIFYMTEEQMRAASEMKLPPIAGFHHDSVDLERDAATIHDNWKYSRCPESTTERLRHLPSSIIRCTATGQAVSWDMASPLGQVNSKNYPNMLYHMFPTRNVLGTFFYLLKIHAARVPRQRIG